MKQSEVEHLFDAHYRASRPRRRIIRVYGGVRGAGAVGDLARGFYSPLLRPATSTSLYSDLPTYDEVCLSLSFLLSILLSLFLSAVSKSFLFDAFVYQLPAKVTEQQFSFTNCDLAGTLHLVYIAIILVALPSVVPFQN